MRGRPTKYTEDMPAKVYEYLDTYPDLDEVTPTVECLSLYLGITKETAYQWAKDPEKSAFSDALGVLKLEQFKKLYNGGLTDKFNTAITKMALNHNHGMMERKASEVSGPGGEPVSVQQITRTIVDP